MDKSVTRSMVTSGTCYGVVAARVEVMRGVKEDNVAAAGP